MLTVPVLKEFHIMKLLLSRHTIPAVSTIKTSEL